MTILIKGDEIDRLVAKYCAMTGVTNKSEAVRQALAAQISVLSAQESLSDRIAAIQGRAAASGIVADGRDDKPFMDAMWGED